MDAVAEEYKELLSVFGLESPVNQIMGIGEYLSEDFDDGSFDIVFCRNALDHHQCPALAWESMFKVLREGGVIVQSHSIREATKEKWRQLHQFDLYPNSDGGLMLENSSGHAFSLTEHLPLVLEKKMINDNGDGTGWFVSHYKKTSGEINDIGWYENLSLSLKMSFFKRSSWAFSLENYIFHRDEEQDSAAIPLKVYVSKDRA